MIRFLQCFSKESAVCRTYATFAPKDQHGLSKSIPSLPGRSSPFLVQVVRVTISIEKGISSIRSAESSAVQLGDGEIRDIKFFGDFLLVLWSAKGRQSSTLPSVADMLICR